MIRSAEKVIKDMEFRRGQRSTWDSHWQEVGDNMAPRKNDFIGGKTPGQKRNADILDNTGMVAGEMLTGSLHGMLLNPSAYFFELTTGIPKLDQVDQVRRWLEDCAVMMHETMNNSNLQTEAYEFLYDLVYFNTAGMTVLEDPVYDVVFRAHNLKELYICENSKGDVAEVFRVFSWEARKVIQEFGMKQVPQFVRDAFEQNREEMFEIVHAIYPADEYGTVKKKNFKHAYVSQFVMVKDKAELKIEGFNENPWVVARWSKAAGEIYGRGPGLNALPEVKMVQLMEDIMIRGAQKTIDPPLQMPDDGFILPIKTKPAGINFRRGGSTASKDGKIEPIFNDARIDFGVEMLRDRRQRIREAFYVDQLQMQLGDRATTSEVMSKDSEKLRFLGPMMGRMKVEFLDPMVSRVFQIMDRRKRFPALPAQLKDKKIEVRFSSAIAKMQRKSESQNIFQALNIMAPFFSMDPDAKDNFNVDNITRATSRMFSLPQDFLRDEDERDSIRKGRQEAMEKQAAQADEMHQAEVVNKAVPAMVDAQETEMASAEEE